MSVNALIENSSSQLEDLTPISVFDSASLLDSAKGLAQTKLQSFAQSQDFEDKMALTFGQGRSVDRLRSIWLTGKVSFPAIEVRTISELNGAYGAFSQDTGKIYLTQELLDSHFTELVTAVLLEEYGHFVDAQLNSVDTVGDEGAIFSAFSRGKPLTSEQIQLLKTENDVSTIFLDGQTIQVEKASVSDSGGFEGSFKTITLDTKGGGTAKFSYEHYFIPDNFIIRYEGQNILETGFVGGSRTGTVQIPEGTSDQLEVIVATDDEGTAWDYSVETLTSGLNIEDAYVDVAAGSDKTAIIKFPVTLSKASTVATTVRYFTLIGTAVDGVSGNDRVDYKPVTGTLTFAPGETRKEIEITVLGDTPVNFGGDKNFEIFARDTAYRDWQKGQDVDQINGGSPYGDLGYRVDKFFNGANDFQAAGLTSNENFFVVISDPINSEISKDGSQEKDRLLTKLNEFLGDKTSDAYQEAEKTLNNLLSQGTSWTFATGTIYDQGKAPVLAIRGTASLQDAWDDTNPSGIGYAQFSANQSTINQWLQEASNPKDTNVSFNPHITGHSLGGALTQWVASDYSSQGALGDVVTFNAPGISVSDANSFAGAKDVTHYVTSTDVVSLAGFRYIPGEFILSNEKFSTFNQIPIYGPHTHPIIVPTIIGGSSKPSNLSKTVDNSVNSLSFTYLPDPDYFVFLLVVSKIPVLGPTVASALRNRGRAEVARTIIGAGLFTADLAIEYAKAATKAAFDAAKQWTSDAWEAVKNWGEDAWNGVSSWSISAWNATTQWTSDAWNATTQWTSDAWNATTQWTSDAWNATTQWTSDAWNATTQWSSNTWNATTQWSSNAWNATTQWLSNILPFSAQLRTFSVLETFEANSKQIQINSPWEATAKWSDTAWQATTKWSDAAWDATTKWTLEQWQATTEWTPEAWQATTLWTDDIWNATAQLDNAAGDQILFGTPNTDNLIGGSGKDIIDGLDSNDALNGADGNDILRGGSGNDVLTGGTGGDSFVFGSPTEGIDIIEDFTSSEGDRIVVSSVGFGGGLTPDAVLEQSQFALGTTSTDRDDRFIYDPATGNLFFDPDGIGSTPQQQIANLNGKPSLSATDIFVSGSSTTPTIKITAPVTDVNTAEVNIQWNAFDPDSKATISLFYDTDNQGFDGILIADGIAEIDGQGSFLWDTRSVPQDDYFIYAKIVDEKNVPVFSYSKGQINLKSGQEADLSVAKTASATSVHLGETFTYKVQVTNNSLMASKEVVLVETLPEPVAFVSASLAASNQVDNSFTFNLGDLAAGETKTIDLVVIAPKLLTGTIAFDTSVSSPTSDPDTTNNIATLLTNIIPKALPDLAITRTEKSGAVGLGGNYSYDLIVSNNGNIAATGVILTESLPSGVDYISSTGSIASPRISGGIITSNLGQINPGESKTLNLVVSSILSGNLVSTIKVTSNEDDSNPLDNLIVGKKTVSSIVPTGIDLELTLTASNLNPTIGDEVTLTITLTNKGPGTATAVKIKDYLPPELTFISASTLQGSYDSGKGVWDVGNMRDNLTRTLQIKAKVNSSQPINYTAEVISVFETDIDSTPNNNNANEDDQASLTLNIASAIPSLTKLADDIFTISGGTAGKPKLQITISDSNPKSVNDFAVFTVDDAQGRINGIAPTETGYTQAALSRAKNVFSAIANLPNGFDPKTLSRFLEFNSGENLRFLLVKNDTLDNVRKKNVSSPSILFSNANTQKITDSGTGSFTLAWEDGNGNSSDFQDFVVNIQSTDTSLPLGANLQDQQQGEVLDLSSVDPSKTVQANFVVNREAAFNNFVGFYKISDSQGTIIDPLTGVSLKPGDTGYTEAAIKNRVAGIDLQTTNQSTATINGAFQGGSIFAPFIVVNGSVNQLLDADKSNDPAVYFAYLGANSDGVDHIRLLGNNTFGFEDLPSGGDFDYNDIIIKANLSVV
jgi:uncharacterized repeat protein (TIGR01451 family)